MLNNRLQYECQTGGIKDQPDNPDTGWRVLPCIVCAYVHDGPGKMWLGDNPAISFRKHDLVWIPAGVRHRVIGYPDSAGRRRFSWLHLNYYTQEGMDLFALYDCPNVISPPMSKSIASLIKKWLKHHYLEDDASLQTAVLYNSIGYEILAILAPICQAKPISPTRLRAGQRVSHVLDYIKNNIAEDISRDMLASLAGLSVPQFHRVFIEATGLCPMSFVRQQRLSQARKLLLYTAEPVGSIAEMVGYKDQFVFSKMFNRESHLSPLEYRKQNKY